MESVTSLVEQITANKEHGMIAVDGLMDALRMRNIRNEVRNYMTHNTDRIGLFEQLKWFEETYKPAEARGEMQGFLLWHEQEPVGYGLITLREDQYWVSGGLTAASRGLGLGEYLFTYLTRYARFRLDAPEVWLDVRADNERARRLYEKIGYKPVEETEELIVMRYTPPEVDRVWEK